MSSLICLGLLAVSSGWTITPQHSTHSLHGLPKNHRRDGILVPIAQRNAHVADVPKIDGSPTDRRLTEESEQPKTRPVLG